MKTQDEQESAKVNKAEAVRQYLAKKPKAKNKEVIEALAKEGIDIDPSSVSKIMKRSITKTKESKVVAPKKTKNEKHSIALKVNYPRHSVEKALRIPKAILDQNAGRECTEQESAKYVGTGVGGPYNVEVSSAIKYGLLERPSPGKVAPTDLSRKILRPQSTDDRINGLREAVLKAPYVSAVYRHYRGENIPDLEFFENTLVDTFGIPKEKTAEFIAIFKDSLKSAKLIEEHSGKTRVLDVSDEIRVDADSSKEIKSLSKGAKIGTGDICFVVMPFAPPLGDYYTKVYEPAIKKAGLIPIRADAEIFGTGKIIDQIWSGINSAKVLVAELTTRNANVFYELGMAHALEKPVVLVSSNEEDVPFDLQHIRVIYYDVKDPFWGEKLIEKVAENVISAINNPEEAVFKRNIN